MIFHIQVSSIPVDQKNQAQKRLVLNQEYVWRCCIKAGPFGHIQQASSENSDLCLQPQIGLERAGPSIYLTLSRVCGILLQHLTGGQQGQTCPAFCAFLGDASHKEITCQCRRYLRDAGSGRSSGGRHGNPLQYSCLQNSMDRGAGWAAVHGVHQELDMTEATQCRRQKWPVVLIHVFLYYVLNSVKKKKIDSKGYTCFGRTYLQEKRCVYMCVCVCMYVWCIGQVASGQK